MLLPVLERPEDGQHKEQYVAEMNEAQMPKK